MPCDTRTRVECQALAFFATITHIRESKRQPGSSGSNILHHSYDECSVWHDEHGSWHSFVMIITEPEVCIDKAFLALMNCYANAWFTKLLQRTGANHFVYWCMSCTGCHWWYIWIKSPSRQCPNTCGTYMLLISHTNTCSNQMIVTYSFDIATNITRQFIHVPFSQECCNTKGSWTSQIQMISYMTFEGNPEK